MRPSQILSLIVLGVGGFVLLGWLTGNEVLMRIVPGLIAMKANTAICFMLFAASGYLVALPSERAKTASKVLAAIGGVIALLTFLEIVTGINIGIDEFLFVDIFDPTGTAAPGRMAPLTALSFSLLGIITVFDKRLPQLASQLALIGVLAIAVSAFASYPFSLISGGGFFSVSGMALNTAALFVILAIAYILEQPAIEWMRVLLSPTALGDRTHKLIAAAIILPFLLGMVITAGERSGLLDEGLGRLYYSISVMLIMSVLVLFNAQRLASVESSYHDLRSDYQSVSQQLQTFIDVSPSAIFIKSADGRYQLVNKHFESLANKPRSFIIGKKANSIFARTLLEKVLESDRHVIETRGVVNSELQITTQGALRTYLNTKFPIFENDQIVAIGGIWTDVTEQQALADSLNSKNTDLERSNKELEQFAYVASHDLQEPLRMVSSYMQLLENRYKDKLDADASEFIGYAVDGAERMQRLIQDLLAFSRVGTKGKVPEPVASQDSLNTALKNLQVRIEETKAKITHDEMPQILADKNQLTQVFQNLLGNAMKFTGDKPADIEIRVKELDSFVQFTVRDHGIGFDPKHAERIFVLFQRLNSREVYEGTGIGLAICKKIVERHGGRIWAEAQIGKGASFHFTFPTVPEVVPDIADQDEVIDTSEEAETLEERAGRLI